MLLYHSGGQRPSQSVGRRVSSEDCGGTLFQACLLGWQMAIFLLCLPTKLFLYLPVSVSICLPFYKNMSHIGWRPTSMTFFKLVISVLTLSPNSPVLRYWGSGLQHVLFKGHNSFCNTHNRVRRKAPRDSASHPEHRQGWAGTGSPSQFNNIGGWGRRVGWRKSKNLEFDFTFRSFNRNRISYVVLRRLIFFFLLRLEIRAGEEIKKQRKFLSD